jgi:hypothetical protein
LIRFTVLIRPNQRQLADRFSERRRRRRCLSSAWASLPSPKGNEVDASTVEALIGFT